MTSRPGKRKRGRPPKPMPEPIPDTPERIAWAIMQVPPRTEWILRIRPLTAPPAGTDNQCPWGSGCFTAEPVECAWVGDLNAAVNIRARGFPGSGGTIPDAMRGTSLRCKTDTPGCVVGDRRTVSPETALST